MAPRSLIEIEEDLAVARVILESLDYETFEGIEGERQEAREKITQLEDEAKDARQNPGAVTGGHSQHGGKSQTHKTSFPTSVQLVSARARRQMHTEPCTGCRLCCITGERVSVGTSFKGFTNSNINDTFSHPLQSLRTREAVRSIPFSSMPSSSTPSSSMRPSLHEVSFSYGYIRLLLSHHRPSLCLHLRNRRMHTARLPPALPHSSESKPCSRCVHGAMPGHNSCHHSQ